MRLRQLFEGGNLTIGGKEAEQINLKVTNRSYIVPILNDLLNAINTAFTKQYKTPLWKSELLKSQKFLSGSSLHFFNVKGISDDQFVTKKPKVGDIDTMVAKEAEPNLEAFLKSVEGQQLGPATLIGFQRGNEQFSSLWELQDPPIKIQIDLEFVAFDKDEPTPWSRFSHSSAWEDLQAGVKGVFHKFLIQALPVLGRKEFLLRKLVGRGKARTEQDVPTEDNMVSFAVSSKEGGGLRAKYEPVLDEKGLPLIIDGLQVMRALPPEGYEKNIDQIFLTLFGDRIGPKQAKTLSEKYWSFTGLLDVMNQLLTPEEKSVVVDGFIKKLFDKAAQGLYRGDPERDSAEKSAALDLMLKTLNVSAPSDLEQMKADYKANYRVPTNESIVNEAEPNYRRQGVPHIYNPGSTVEMKDLDFIEMAKEIAANGGNLDGMAINLKADGAGIRFGRDTNGKPFFMTSKVTEPKYLDNYGDFEKYATDMGQSPERIAFAKNYDEALKTILTSDLIDAVPADTIVQAEMMYNPMAEKTKDGLRFVNIPYDPKKLGKTMTLVPFMFKTYSTGETSPDAQEIRDNLVATSNPNIKIISNQLKQKGVNVSNIIDPVINMDPELVNSLRPRSKLTPAKEQAKEILNKARKELSDTIMNSPAIVGKDALGSHIEGLLINMPSGRMAKVTSSMMKSAVAAKQTSAKTAKQGPAKTAVVAIGSFVGHRGHEELWDYTVKKAAEVGGDPYLFIGHGVGVDDPIPPAVKVQTWQKLYPEYKNNISTVEVQGGSLMQKIKHELINPTPGQPPKYDNIIIMVGEDQAKMNIAAALMKAVNKFPGYEHVKAELAVTPRGTGMSFTKLRNILKDPNATPEQQYALWAQGFDEQRLGKDWILHLMDVTKKGMGIVSESIYESLTRLNEKSDPCWKGYKQVGMKKKGDKQVPNCVPTNESFEDQEYIQQIAQEFIRRTKLGRHTADEGTIMQMLDRFFKKFGISDSYFDGAFHKILSFVGGDQPTEDAAGVGIITAQNTTADVNKGTLNKMMKGYHLTDNVTIDEGILSTDVAHALKRYGEHINSNAFVEIGKLFSNVKYDQAMRTIASLTPEQKKTALKIIAKAGGLMGQLLSKTVKEETCEGNEFYDRYGIVESTLEEAEYQGRNVTLGKPMRGDVKKFKVYVKDPKTGNVKKVNFGDPDMKIKAYDPERRRSFRARHNCDNPGPKTKARYWSCRKW